MLPSTPGLLLDLQDSPTPMSWLLPVQIHQSSLQDPHGTPLGWFHLHTETHASSQLRFVQIIIVNTSQIVHSGMDEHQYLVEKGPVQGEALRE